MIKKKQVVAIAGIVIVSSLVVTTFNMNLIAFGDSFLAGGLQKFARTVVEAILELQADVDSLNASHIELQSKLEMVEDKVEMIATYNVGNWDMLTTSSTNFVNMTDIGLTIELQRDGYLLAFFTFQGYNEDPGKTIHFRLTGFPAFPGFHMPSVAFESGHSHEVNIGTYDHHFSAYATAGTYDLQMEWAALWGGTAHACYSNLAVMVIPA